MSSAREVLRASSSAAIRRGTNTTKTPASTKPETRRLVVSAIILRGCHNGAVVEMRSCDVESTRVDKWLWAVRVYPTRTVSSDKCSGGHVRVNGGPVKPATTVRIGDRVTANVGGEERILEVARIVEKRVSATVAAECFVDHSPPPRPRDDAMPVFTRDRGTGRPTKRDRRQLDRLRSR